MFKKISKLKNFGIFHDFLWDEGTPDLARFNLIYGWNRSGKTTLSRVFAACEKRTTGFDGYPHDGEFNIKMKDGSSINQKSCRDATHHVRVFNRDFVEENVFFDSEDSRANPIVYVSKEDIKSAQKLQKLQKEESSLENEYNAAKRIWEEKDNEEKHFREGTAQKIKNEVGDLKVHDKYRIYHKGTLGDEITKTGIENFRELSSEDCEKQRTLIRSEQPETLELLPEYSFELPYSNRKLHGFSEISGKVSALLARSIVSKTIKRLEDDGEINKWVERGFHLHKDKNEERKCLFCENELKANFFESLSKHFSNDYENLQQDIDSFIAGLTGLKKERIPQENQNLSAGLQDKYRAKAVAVNAILEEVNGWIDEATEKLNEKRGNPLQILESVACPQDFGRLCNGTIRDLNSVVKEHNRESQNHGQRVRKAKEELESHIIARNIREKGYLRIKSDLDLNNKKKNQAKKELNETQKKLLELEKKTSDIGGAVTEINQYLGNFFGRKEIELELDSSKKGYVVRRNGERASNLSEGEKNAIAFSYFIIKTREEGFNIKQGTIVIDDPVSSFDSTFTYLCFSLVENSFTDAEQLILLTHNFEFFSLVKNWFRRKNRPRNNRANEKSRPCEFFMIRNEMRNKWRCALVVPLDKTLQKFSSEYHFLFSELIQFLDRPGDEYADFYRIGNVARRFLEIYANFKIPHTDDDLRGKLNQLCEGCVSETEKVRLYRLIQESSHGRDPLGAIEHKDRSEIKNAIEILMKVVEGSDKKHFESLCKEIQSINV